ncbi:hypothetical protein [Actinomadura meyerae]|nr:hypothetical protein [Actinomadura meyerae]
MALVVQFAKEDGDLRVAVTPRSVGLQGMGVATAVTCAVMGTVTACSSDEAEGRPTRAASPSRPPSGPPSWPTKRAWTPDAHVDEAACRRKKPAPWRKSSDPYAGAGPHYVHPIRVQMDPAAPEHAMDSKDLSTMPDDMQLPQERIPDAWQLIACIYSGHPTRRAGTVKCYFNNVKKSKTFPFYESRYEVIVREARTGKKVTTVSVPGTKSRNGNCPSFVVDAKDTIILKPMDGRALGEKLRPVFRAVKKP